MATFYINSKTLESATQIFDDAALTICAADGFYSDGIITRQLVSCNLLPVQACPSCNNDCGFSTLTETGAQGIYTLDIDLGDQPNDLGAVVIKMNPSTSMVGMSAVFEGDTYNEMSAQFDGYHKETFAGSDLVATFVGDTAADCGIDGSTYPSLDNFLYNGTDFDDTGNPSGLIVETGQVSSSTAPPENCYMVIPKVSSSATDLTVTIYAPCASSQFQVEVACPTLLTSFPSTPTPQSTALAACGSQDTLVSYYNVPVTGSAGQPDLHDWVFGDEYGIDVLPNGFYKVVILGVDYSIEVENGVVISKAAC